MPTYIDNWLFYFMNSKIANPVLDFLMPLTNYIGSGDVVFAAAILIIVFCKKDKKRSGILILAGLALTYYSVLLLKDAVARSRPYMILPDVRLLVPADPHFSFPSGHATTAFMAAVVLSGFFKKRPIWISLAAVVCFSRVYTGAHYVSDVLAGAGLGAIIGWGLLKFAEYTHMS